MENFGIFVWLFHRNTFYWSVDETKISLNIYAMSFVTFEGTAWYVSSVKYNAEMPTEA